MRSAKRASISSSVIGAASRMRLCAAVPVSSATARNGSRASAEAGSTLPPRPLASRNAPSAAAVLGDAVGIGERRGARRPTARRSPRAAARRRSSAQRFAIRAHPRRGASGRGGTDRAGGARSTSLPPSPRSVSIAAMSAASWPAPSRRRIDHHAREPRRQRQRGAACWPSSVMRPLGVDARRARSSSARASVSAPLRRRIEERELARIGRAPLRQIEQRSPTDRPTGFPAAHRLRARRSAARPTAGSRRRARCGRRGRGAGRRRRATPARFRAASGRRPARSAARAPARNR